MGPINTIGKTAMSIDELVPTGRNRVMDLLQEVGLDVSDWSNFKGGTEKAASNPKYCYEWSFEDRAKKLIVLCLWISDLEEVEGRIKTKLNLPKLVEKMDNKPRERRASKMDYSLQWACHTGWPMRVIICEQSPSSKESKVQKRKLDDQLWYIESRTDDGDTILVRGTEPAPKLEEGAPLEAEADVEGDRYSDQFKVTRESSVYPRSSEIRRQVLERAKGQCEYCGKDGFVMKDGSIYLESHHVIPLSEGGPDALDNVIALCPDHHREAHYGVNWADLRRELIKIACMS